MFYKRQRCDTNADNVQTYNIINTSDCYNGGGGCCGCYYIEIIVPCSSQFRFTFGRNEVTARPLRALCRFSGDATTCAKGSRSARLSAGEKGFFPEKTSRAIRHRRVVVTFTPVSYTSPPPPPLSYLQIRIWLSYTRYLRISNVLLHTYICNKMNTGCPKMIRQTQ